jgi:hypothetical protein
MQIRKLGPGCIGPFTDVPAYARSVFMWFMRTVESKRASLRTPFPPQVDEDRLYVADKRPIGSTDKAEMTPHCHIPLEGG